MTTETDLPVWLLEQIAEDEKNAREVSGSELSGSIVPHAHTALGPRWEAQHGIVAAEGISWDGVAEGFIGTTLWDVRDGRTTSSFAAVHIARWDPERVLAECDAKRQIVAMYRNAVAARSTGSASDRNRIADEIAVDVLYSVVQIHAETYAAAGRPGYREEWRP